MDRIKPVLVKLNTIYVKTYTTGQINYYLVEIENLKKTIVKNYQQYWKKIRSILRQENCLSIYQNTYRFTGRCTNSILVSPAREFHQWIRRVEYEIVLCRVRFAPLGTTSYTACNNLYRHRQKTKD